MKPISVYAVQLRSTRGDLKENCARLVGHVEHAAKAKAQLCCFPEACLTGYDSSEPGKLAIPDGHKQIVRLEKRAAELGIAISYGFIERGAGRPFVTHVVTDGVERLVYRKTHLGQSELESFAAGDVLPTACIAGVQVGVFLCWEMHLPDIATTLRGKGAELFLVPFASPVGGPRRREIWERSLAARAADNGAYVVASNALSSRAGEPAGGGLAAFGPKGECLASCYTHVEQSFLVELDGLLPRDTTSSSMADTSYFDRRRPELYS